MLINLDENLDDFSAVSDYVIKNRRLPDNFNRFSLADEHGTSIAHIAALFGCLPTTFKEFYLADRNGRTVAHIALARGGLPLWFNDFHLSDQKGWTVAHEAAKYGHLPPGFDQWHLENPIGQTVLEAFIFYGMEGHANRSLLFDLKVWPDKEMTVADYILNEKKLSAPVSEQLKSEVLAWKMSQEITAQSPNSNNSKIASPTFKKT